MTFNRSTHSVIYYSHALSQISLGHILFTCMITNLTQSYIIHMHDHKSGGHSEIADNFNANVR